MDSSPDSFGCNLAGRRWLELSPAAKLVADTQKLLVTLDSPGRDSTGDGTLQEDLTKNLGDMKLNLSGMNAEGEDDPAASAQLTREIFRGDTLRLMIRLLPKLHFEARKDATAIAGQLLTQSVSSEHANPIASDYRERNTYLVGPLLRILVNSIENLATVSHDGKVLRDCIRHKTAAQFLFDDGCWRKLLDYIEPARTGRFALPFDVGRNAWDTFKLLMTTHQTIVARYLAENYESFFDAYHSQLLESDSYTTCGRAARLLSKVLLDPSNERTKLRYISSTKNFWIVLSILVRADDRNEREVLGVFELFVKNPNKPHDIVTFLGGNWNSLDSRLIMVLERQQINKEEKEEIFREINLCGRFFYESMIFTRVWLGS